MVFCLVALTMGMLLGVGCASVDPTLPVARRSSGRYEALPTGGFDQVTRPGAGPVVLFFYSPSCPYCKALMKKARAGVEDGKPWLIYTVNIREEPYLRSQLGVGPVPCLIYYRNGQEVDRTTGWRPGFALSGRLDKFFR
jgi:thioredoxin 1